MSNKPNRPVLPTDATGEGKLVYSFPEEEYRHGIAALNNGKAAGIDEVLVEQLNNLGLTSHKRLLDMLNNLFTENKVLRL